MLGHAVMVAVATVLGMTFAARTVQPRLDRGFAPVVLGFPCIVTPLPFHGLDRPTRFACGQARIRTGFAGGCPFVQTLAQTGVTLVMTAMMLGMMAMMTFGARRVMTAMVAGTGRRAVAVG